MLPIFKDNITRFDQLPERLEILAEDFAYENSELIKDQKSKEIFRAAISVLDAMAKPSVGAPLVGAQKGQVQDLSLQYDDFVDAVKSKVKARGKDLFHPIRIALTGKERGPELKRIFLIFGADRIKKRFERALKG